MNTFSGVVSEIRFSSEESGFAVIRVHSETDGDQVAVGSLSMLRVGEAIDLLGDWVTDKKWGKQFRATAFEYRVDSGEAEVEYMLGSGLIDGLGKKRAADIVAHFGSKTLDILDNHPERIKEVPGIGKKRFTLITESWKRKQQVRELMLFLKPYGLSINLVTKINKVYSVDAKAKISENPYRLIEDMRGVGFKTADQIAAHIGYKPDSYRRLGAALIHSLHDAEKEGHLFLEKGELLKRASELTGIAGEKIIFSVDHLKEEKILVEDDFAVYLSVNYHMEVNVSKMFAARMDHSKPEKVDEAEVTKWAEEKCSERGIEVNEQQMSALLTAVKEKIMLLTGGPGTGKTTTVRMIVDRFYSHGKKIVLAAPTGRAAQKMGEVAEREAKTIHRLLEFNAKGDGPKFLKNEDNPIKADVIIVDEFSMVDLSLANSLLKAVPKECHLILVGDADQLPSVGAGRVLADIIDSQKIPHISLTKIFRQAGKSRIVTAAHEICHGTVPLFTNGKEENCFFLEREEPEACFNTVIELVTKRLPDAYSLSPSKDIQVITAMHKGTVGTEEINKALQKKLNIKAGAEVTLGEKTFAVGDKVMQIANNYQKQVFNGDIGFIAAMKAGEITVAYPNIIVEYEKAELNQLTHAYCITIHKSQGSEFPALVIPLSTQHFVMLRRNLIYTALTRAKKLCIFVGSRQALSMAVRNAVDKSRNSKLAKRIVENLPKGES